MMGTSVGHLARQILPKGHPLLNFIVAFIHSEETFGNDIWGYAAAAFGPALLGTVISTTSTHADVDYTKKYRDNIAVPSHFDPHWLKNGQHMHDYISQQIQISTDHTPKIYQELIRMGQYTQLFVDAYVATIYPDDVTIDTECREFIQHLSEILEPRGLPTTSKTHREKLASILAHSLYAIIFHQFGHWDIIHPACQLGLNSLVSPWIDNRVRDIVRDQPFHGWKDIEWTEQSTYRIVYEYVQNILSVSPITYSHW
jgi:hypothetical protein